MRAVALSASRSDMFVAPDIGAFGRGRAGAVFCCTIAYTSSAFEFGRAFVGGTCFGQVAEFLAKETLERQRDVFDNWVDSVTDAEATHNEFIGCFFISNVNEQGG